MALGNASVPTIPSTSAGYALAAWLDAFNSGDRARIETFDETHVPWLRLDSAMDLRAHTGGYDLLGIEKSGERWIIFRAREKTSSRGVIGKVIVTLSDPAVISELSLEVVRPGSKSWAMMLDAEERDRVIENAARLIDEFYVFPEAGAKMSAALRMRQQRGEYQAINDGDVLAYTLTDDLFAVGDDKHLKVRFSAETVPPDPTRPLYTDSKVRQQLLADNCGFERVEHLRPNIGYLKLNAFAHPAVCAPTAIAAMNFLAHSDVLIFDLRDNHGGRGEMAALIASYLFDQPTRLSDLYSREGNATTQTWTLPYVPGEKVIGKPVYLLTSRATFSVAEEFSYDLKNLGRATLIGESTGGGAHTVAPRRLDDHFFMELPSGRFINPITKTDWEGVGVEPDIKVPAADALDAGLKRARSAP